MSRTDRAGTRAIVIADMAEPEAGALGRLAALNHLLKLHNRLMVPFATHLEHRHRITLNEFRVLMLVGQLGSTANHELAREIGVNTMAISRAVAALSSRGLVRATVDPSSRRRKILRLTDAGRDLFEAMHPSTVKVADYLFSPLREREVQAFDRLVATLTARLEAQDEEGRSRFLQETRPD